MPIVRTYQCGECFHRMEVTLRGDQWDEEPPDCPACAARRMNQEFKPPAIGGSTYARAVKVAETIAAEDYGVADMKIEGYHGVPNKVRYKDQPNPAQRSTWGAGEQALQMALRSGREVRTKHGGDGLDILQANLKSGAQPDLIEVSKKNMMRIY